MDFFKPYQNLLAYKTIHTQATLWGTHNFKMAFMTRYSYYQDVKCDSTVNAIVQCNLQNIYDSNK